MEVWNLEGHIFMQVLLPFQTNLSSSVYAESSSEYGKI